MQYLILHNKMGSKAEDHCKDVAERILGVKMDKVRLDMFKNPETGRNLELDMYNEELRIAIEYHGMQHYIFPSHWYPEGKEDEFRKQLRRDDYKRKVCKACKITLITVPYTVKKPDMEQFLRRKLNI